MALFSIEDFCSNPSSQLPTIASAKKSDLVAIAVKLNVFIPPNAKKDNIRNCIIQHCISAGLVDSGEAGKYLVELKDKPNTDVEYMRLAIKLEQMKRDSMNVELEKKQRELEIEQEKKKMGLEMKKKELEVETQALLERKQQELQFEQAKLNFEAQIAQQVEENKSKMSFENKKKELELEARQPHKFDLSKCIKLVPNFDEIEVDVFFKNFEDMASYMKWPLEQWVWLVKSKLIGKAATVVGSLIGELNYGVIKQAVLDAYAVTSEGCRQKFRNYVKPFDKTWTEFAAEKLRLFKKWLESENVNTFEQLVNLIVTEEFKRRLPQNIMVHISDKEEKDLKKAAVLADNYSLIHKAHLKGSQGNVKQHRTEQSGDGNVKTDKSLFCNYCKKEGHTIASCKNPSCKKRKMVGK